MGRFRPAVFGGTILAISVVIFIILISLDGDGGIGASVPFPTLEFVADEQGNPLIFDADGNRLFVLTDFPIENVACWVSQEVTLRDADGRFIGQSSSPFFRTGVFLTTPTFSFVDTETGRDVAEGSFNSRPEIKCVTGEIETFSGGFAPVGEIDPLDPALFDTLSFPSVETPLVIQDSFFKVRIYAQLPNQTWKEVFNTIYKVERFEVTSPTTHFLENLPIQQVWIQRYLPMGDYNTNYRFVYDGAFVMNWKESNICTGTCPLIDFVIPVETQRTFNAEGQLIDVQNEFQVTRAITVGKGTVGIDIECDELTEVIDPETGVCVPIPSEALPCPQGQVRSGGVCVNIGKDPDDLSDISVPFEELFSKIRTCLASGQPACLASAELLPLWIFGIGIVVILGAVAQRRQPEIYGVPT